MIPRIITQDIVRALRNFPCVSILGARQTGKTTLAKSIAKHVKRDAIYLDLESPTDRNKLEDAYTFLDDNKARLIIIDEVQRMPELFSMLRSLIDKHRKNGRFILLGSASPQLVKGVSESLAGRIYAMQLGTINLVEAISKLPIRKHWFRGGLPEMAFSKSDSLASQRIDAYISTFIERDLQSLFGVQFTPAVMRRFWHMLAHTNGGIWNAETYARSLDITGPTVVRYLDFLEAAFMVHRLPAYFANSKKRLVKAPKVYLRDTGIMHRLFRLSNYNDLQNHPCIGDSWEAYVVEQIYQLKHPDCEMFYYRTQNGAEADVVLTKAGRPIACIEIKLSNSPSLSKGFYSSIQDLKTKQNFVVVPDLDSYRKTPELTVSGLNDFLNKHLPKLK